MSSYSKRISVTITQRMKAASLVKSLRDQDSMEAVALKLGIKPIYVTFAESMQKRRYVSKKNNCEYISYHLPGWAVKKILERAG